MLVLQAADEWLELRSVVDWLDRADPLREGTPEIMGRLDSHGSPGL